jgi:hypothetical protein
MILTSFRREFSGAGKFTRARSEQLRFVVDDTPSHARTKHVSKSMLVYRLNIVK